MATALASIVLPLDYIHVLCLIGVLLYVWGREPARLLLTPLTLLSFFILYGVGNIIYFLGEETVPEVRRAVTLSMILMWIGIIAGIELARALAPGLSAQARRIARLWSTTRMHDDGSGDQLLAMVGAAVALFMLLMFLGLGKPSQILTFLSIGTAHEKLKYRLEFGSEGGYLYRTLAASVAPFLSFLLLSKAACTGRRYLLLIGGAVCLAAFAGKLGTFEKVPWLVYILQLMIVFQARKRLEIGVGRILMFLIILLGGVVAATLIAIPDLQSTDLLSWLGFRFFQVNSEVIYQTFYVYPEHLPHTWGMNIGLVHALLGTGELQSAHTQVANFFGAEGATFDAFFIADAWVDFSYAGVAVMAVLVGLVLKMVDMFVLSRGKTPLSVALLASGMYGLFQLQVTSAFTAFLSGGLVLIPLLVLGAEGLMNDLTRGRLQWQR
ncbi:MAG TPA: hypothetical protein VFB37_06115 [Steroidobacteraceae bacterium]|nr:hypothetical protein [Steroidobacteraceae bacterium]